MYSIYKLICPISKEVTYVGMTKDVVYRYKQHLRNKDNIKKWEWISDLKSKGLMPLLEIVESGLNQYEAEEREKHYISVHNGLFNIQLGGLNPTNRKGTKQSVETRKKMFDSSPLKKGVIQKTKQGEFVKEFEGVREACRLTGIDYRSIGQVASGSKVRKSAGGYLWEYKV
jgi:predicted GIY-YIG superfamily endonuclease